ncbi:hypothetical protein BGZ63DRAFT_420851 [Mariannaea sp. PMI_226]|nr:hypothetical protein BGZ63DRAFT_420851 [Mariannaea sp. PMI_226]
MSSRQLNQEPSEPFIYGYATFNSVTRRPTLRREEVKPPRRPKLRREDAFTHGSATTPSKPATDHSNRNTSSRQRSRRESSSSYAFSGGSTIENQSSIDSNSTAAPDYFTLPIRTASDLSSHVDPLLFEGEPDQDVLMLEEKDIAPPSPRLQSLPLSSTPPTPRLAPQEFPSSSPQQLQQLSQPYIPPHRFKRASTPAPSSSSRPWSDNLVYDPLVTNQIDYSPYSSYSVPACSSSYTPGLTRTSTSASTSAYAYASSCTQTSQSVPSKGPSRNTPRKNSQRW